MSKRPVALVTGGARGIGLAIAAQLAEIGYDVAIDDIHAQNEVTDALETVRKHGVEVLYVQADVSKTRDRQYIVDQIRQTFGRIDLLMNNAGVAPKTRLDILETTEESFDRVMKINLHGPFFLSQAVANWMLEQKKEYPDRDYKIINTASLSSYASSPSRGEYCVSKAGISMMTKLFADRLAGENILVYEIRPGIIATDMTAVVKEKYDTLIAEGLLPIKRWGYPEDIAKVVAGIALGYLNYSTGEVINVDGGFHLQRL